MKKPIIRYDEQSLKSLRTAMIVTGVIALLSWVVTLLYFFFLSYILGDILFFSLFGLVFGKILFPFVLLSYLDSVIYLKRLKKNHFTVPIKRSYYNNDLRLLPRTAYVENCYAKDSIIAAVLSLSAYALVLGIDYYIFIVRWMEYDEGRGKAGFELLMIPELVFLVSAVLFFRQCNKKKYLDEVDIPDGRKVRVSIIEAVEIILAFLVASLILTYLMNELTRYMYLSHNSSYERQLSSFKEDAKMTVLSENLHDGVWDDEITCSPEGGNLSPHLYFDPVDGADHYVVYMVDESITGSSRLCWLATDIHENELLTGDNLTIHADDPEYQYIGPDPDSSYDHICTIYVYALRGDPDCDISDLKAGEDVINGMILYYDDLNVIERGGFNHLTRFGNVISYGFVSGEYGTH